MREPYTLQSRMEHAAVAIRLIRNWPLFLLQYFGVINKPSAVYRLRNGCRFRIRRQTADFLVLREIYYYGEYTDPRVAIQAGDTVVDIGAQIGLFSVAAARQAPQGRVYALEPAPENFAILSENLRMNNCSQATPLNLAAASCTGSKTLYLSQNTAGHSFHNLGPQSRPTEVQTVSLLDFMAQQRLAKIDFLKIDCEGAEREILESCPDDLFESVKKMAIEIHPDYQSPLAGMMDFLRSKGYCVDSKYEIVYAWR